MNRFQSRSQASCYHRPSSYAPRRVGANLRFFDQTGLATKPGRLLLQTKTGPAQPKTAPPNPKIPTQETRLKFPPPTNHQPQQELFRQGLPGSKSTTLILGHRLTPTEREQLVEDHRPLVDNLLRNYKPTGLPHKAEVGLATAAQIGLITAAENFEDHRPKRQFVVYARTVIVDEIQSELRSYQTVGS